MKKKRKGLKALLIVLGAFAVVIGGFAWFLLMGMGIRNVAVKAVDISKVADGVYVGKLSDWRFSNELQATVAGGKITDIKILKNVAIAKPETSKALFEAVEQKQSLQVDTVSGATVTSKAYLLALEDALD